jgi:transcriptional regulator with XRE-family HTH domain
MSGTSDKNGTAAEKPDIDVLRAEIKQTRTELGETVQALAAKADVKARAKDQVEQTKQRVKAQALEATERVRDAAVAATDAVRGKAVEAGDKVAVKVTDTVSADRVQRVRTNPEPLMLLFAGVAAVVGVILIVRGRGR